MKIITPLDENKDVDYANSFTIFLAGGCTTNWRDEFVKKLSAHCTSKNIVVFSPFCDSKNIKLRDLLFWEREHLINCDMIVFNFEGSDSPQPGSMFELGRYAISKAIHGNVIVNIDDNFKLKREVEIHVELLNIEAGLCRAFDNIPKIEVIHSDLDKMIERCAEIIAPNKNMYYADQDRMKILWDDRNDYI